MGQTDTMTKQYMQDTEVFADVFNYFIYDGKPVIHPEQLHELDTTELVTLFGDNNANTQVQVYRDILKSVTAMDDGRYAYLILGIENQTGIHYAMPVRNLLYDALQYHSQVKAISKKHRKSESTKRLSKDAYVSGFRKEDKLLPVITLVVYFGTNAWDGPKSLHEMFALEDTQALACVADYRLNLLEPAAMTESEIDKLKSDLKDVFYFIKYSSDKNKLMELVENQPAFHNMKRSTAEMIKSVTNTDIHFPEGKKEDRIDMCLAIEQMREESEAIGLVKGESIGLAKGESIGRLKGRQEGESIGRTKGKMETLIELVKVGLLTVDQAASTARMSEEAFKAKMAKAGF